MATLKNVQDSMNGTQDDNSSFTPAITLEDKAPIVEQQYVIFKLKTKKRGRHYLDGINSAVNPKTNKRERIYLIRGADSIWQSELTELLKDKDYVAKNRDSILFEDGIARVHVSDERRMEYAKANNNNIAVEKRVANGKHDFYEYNPVAESAERFKKQMLKINMVVKAKEMDGSKMKKLASFLGISPVDELGIPKGDEAIRTELMIKADTDPITFEKYIDSKEVDISYMVKKAIIDAKIDLTAQAGNAIWAEGKGFIGKIPFGRKHYEYLTELAMTNSPEGKGFLEQLQQIIK
jgi:hypothetical protein